MAMRVYECEQGSDVWHALRAGVITASMVKVARSRVGGLDERQQKFVDAVLKDGMSEARAIVHAGYKARPTSETVARALVGEKVGEPSELAKNYAFRLAIERISGEPLQDDKFETYAMRRGHELEPDARAAHEKLGVMVARAGFVTTEDGWIGASVDGLIAPNGASEYKCLVSPEGLRQILLNDDLSEFTDQVQTGLLVTERDFMHFGLYCPALESIGQAFSLRLVERDEAYIGELRTDLDEFKLLVTSYESALRAAASINVRHITHALDALSLQ